MEQKPPIQNSISSPSKYVRKHFKMACILKGKMILQPQFYTTTTNPPVGCAFWGATHLFFHFQSLSSCKSTLSLSSILDATTLFIALAVL